MKPDRSPRSLRGFTLIELMIVVSVIGILAAIAIPKFADMIRKAREGATLGGLGALRSALHIYYSSMEGQYPDYTGNLSILTLNGKYINAIPTSYILPYHQEWSSSNSCYANVPAHLNLNSLARGCAVSSEVAHQGGIWSYINLLDASGVVMDATITASCGHTDSKGNLWTSY